MLLQDFAIIYISTNYKYHVRIFLSFCVFVSYFKRLLLCLFFSMYVNIVGIAYSPVIYKLFKTEVLEFYNLLVDFLLVIICNFVELRNKRSTTMTDSLW